jgi:hypothetical protein
MNGDPSYEWMSISEAARHAGVDISTIRSAIAEGRLHPRRVQARTWIARSELRQLSAPVRGAAAKARAVTLKTGRSPVTREAPAASGAPAKPEFSLEDWLRQTSVRQRSEEQDQ